MDLVYLVNNDEKVLIDLQFIENHIRNLCLMEDDRTPPLDILHLDIGKLAKNIYPKLKNENTMIDFLNQITTCSAEMVCEDYLYQTIAARIFMMRLHQLTNDNFLDVTIEMYNNKNSDGDLAPIVTKKYLNFVVRYHNLINNALNYKRDFEISFFGLSTLNKSYLKKKYDGSLIERPQHMYMRVAIAIHMGSNDIASVIETYNYMSTGYFTHATPTLFNAGTQCQQLSSCFLLGVNDSIKSITKTWGDCAEISKHSGGIGINFTKIRCNGSYIKSTQGKSSGLRVLKVYDEIANYADQGGKRPGSIAAYLEPWHADIYFFLELKKNTGDEKNRARDLFLALMINDIFMVRVKENAKWSLMCPSECPDLLDKYGDEFNAVYERYESMGKYRKQVLAADLWMTILKTQFETGVPYILFKDAINKKSNQINIGVVNSSNLCAEIVEVSNADMYAVCNLASICLPQFIKDGVFDYDELYKVSRIITRNLNKIIDINYNPVKRTSFTNSSYRPLGIGVQGLADTFAILKTPFDSPNARKLNRDIFETIYFGALSESAELARIDGPYSAFNGSPLSKGLFQFDLWGVDRMTLSGRWDWEELSRKIIKNGVRNSLTTALMPTASTSQIMGNNECFEPFTQNIYTRETMAGEFYVINKHLMKDLKDLNLWNDELVDKIKFYEGSIAKISGIPDEIKQIYRTVWEIPQKSIITMAKERGCFVDQTQSMNLFIANSDMNKNLSILHSCLFYGWKCGLKTGMYYLRTKAACSAGQFGIDIDTLSKIKNEQNSNVCQWKPGMGRREDCASCSS